MYSNGHLLLLVGKRGVSGAQSVAEPLERSECCLVGNHRVQLHRDSDLAMPQDPHRNTRVHVESRKGMVIDLWYAGKTHDFGGNIQALFYPSGIRPWISDVLPGNVHDLAAARENVLGVLRPFPDAMPVLADPGYEGAGHGVHVPVKKPAGVKELDIDTRARNALLRSVRCLGERGFALLTQRWKTLQHVTVSPGRIGLIARAALVLVLFEHKMIT